MPKITRRQAQTVRDAIRTTKIVQRLQQHVFGDLELSAGQIRAAEVLLSKTLPSLAQTDINAMVDQTVQINIIRYADDHAAPCLDATPVPVAALEGPGDRD